MRACLLFLSFGFLLVALLLTGILGPLLFLFGSAMEGMRHSGLGSSTSEQLIECCFPALYFGLSFSIAQIRMPFAIALLGTLISAGLALVWMKTVAADIFQSPAILAAILAAPIASWALHINKRANAVTHERAL
jgi:hypothetical protein